MGNACVFLDRDGTITADKKDEERVGTTSLEIYDHAPLAIADLNAMGFKVIVVTNQPGIGKGLFTCQKVEEENWRMQRRLRIHGAIIDGIYYCPHVDQDNCDCRKPKIGMLMQAKRDHDIDFARSIVIGDNWKDIAMGNAAGCRSILILGNHGGPGVGEIAAVNNLLEAAEYVKGLL